MRYHAPIDWLCEIKMQRILIYVFSLFIVAACAHKIDIQQGNAISEEKLSQVQPGMESRQVRQILGTPLLTDPFHPERWDYYFSVSAGSEVKERYRATLHFSDERLVRIEREGPIPEKDAPQLKPQR
jgi:outer membrane protein assembly factor BamE